MRGLDGRRRGAPTLCGQPTAPSPGKHPPDIVQDMKRARQGLDGGGGLGGTAPGRRGTWVLFVVFVAGLAADALAQTCPAGRWSSTGSAPCTMCAAGTYSPAGATSAAACLACTSGCTAVYGRSTCPTAGAWTGGSRLLVCCSLLSLGLGHCCGAPPSTGGAGCARLRAVVESMQEVGRSCGAKY